jgi:hypothetical protein
MQELLSHRGLGARAQREIYGLDRRVARRQLCERLDYPTVEQAYHPTRDNTLKFNRITHMEIHPFLFYSEVTRCEVTD